MTQAELDELVALRATPPVERTMRQAKKRVLLPLGAPLPVIHQVLYSK